VLLTVTLLGRPDALATGLGFLPHKHRQRRLGRKRSMALREYALGVEALDPVAPGEPLGRSTSASSASSPSSPNPSTAAL